MSDSDQMSEIVDTITITRADRDRAVRETAQRQRVESAAEEAAPGVAEALNSLENVLHDDISAFQAIDSARSHLASLDPIEQESDESDEDFEERQEDRRDQLRAIEDDLERASSAVQEAHEKAGDAAGAVENVF